MVLVTDVPHLPQELRIKEIASRQVTVEWKAPADGGNPLQEYIIFYKPILKESNHLSFFLKKHFSVAMATPTLNSTKKKTKDFKHIFLN